MTRELALVSEIAPTRALIERALDSCLGGWQLEPGDLGALRVLDVGGESVITCWPASQVVDTRALVDLGIEGISPRWLMPLATDDVAPEQAKAVARALEQVSNGKVVPL